MSEHFKKKENCKYLGISRAETIKQRKKKEKVKKKSEPKSPAET